MLRGMEGRIDRIKGKLEGMEKALLKVRRRMEARSVSFKINREGLSGEQSSLKCKDKDRYSLENRVMWVKHSFEGEEGLNRKNQGIRSKVWKRVAKIQKQEDELQEGEEKVRVGC